MMKARRKRKVLVRRRRIIDATTVIDYKKPEILKRFITDRGKIIPRRISGATASQQRQICLAIKRARYLALLPYSVTHRSERGFAGEMATLSAIASASMRRQGPYDRGGDRPMRHGHGQQSEGYQRDEGGSADESHSDE